MFRALTKTAVVASRACISLLVGGFLIIWSVFSVSLVLTTKSDRPAISRGLDAAVGTMYAYLVPSGKVTAAKLVANIADPKCKSLPTKLTNSRLKLGATCSK